MTSETVFSIDPGDLPMMAALMNAFPAELERRLGPVVKKHGEETSADVRENLSGKMLNVQTGRLHGSWAEMMPDPLTYEAETDVFYGWLWHAGHHEPNGVYPLTGGRTVQFRTGHGRWREPRRFAGEPFEQHSPQFVAEANREIMFLALELLS